MVAMQQRAVHLMFTEILIFLLFPMRKKWVKSRWALGVDLVLAAVSAYIGLYVFFEYEVLTQRIGITTTSDLLLGSMAVILLLEATRRAIGAVMPGIAVVFLLYAYFGQYAPEVFAHRGYDIDRIVSQMYLTTEGIYGLVLGVSATFIYLFVLFGAFLKASGGGQLFIDLAYGLFRAGTGRSGQGSGGRQRSVRDGLGERCGQCGGHGHVYHSPHEEHRLPAPVCRRGRSRGLLRRPAHAPSHGSRGVHHGRDPPDFLFPDLLARGLAGPPLLFLLFYHGGPGGGQDRTEGECRPQSCPRSGRFSRREACSYSPCRS